ncbi:hypothetical protein [Aquimarina algiphila]|uniref:hypothetical protein n=1 Tax=Aquimarina algiphila TaxID=2047982 RepID=UPI0024918A0F|nr:hypothetical protein [Aquimarina algiphila]
MNVKSNLVTLIVMVIVSVSIFSCSDGEDGAIGPTGADGEQGEPGTANVIYSDWIASEIPQTMPSSFQNFPIAENIEDDIIDSGVILVYGRTASNAVWALPTILDFSSQVNYSFAVGSNKELTVAVSLVSGSLDLPNNAYLTDYRYVLIPGGQLMGGGVSGSKSAKNKNVDYSKMSYEEITTQFNIPE